MKFSPDSTGDAYAIRAYDRGYVLVNERRIQHSVIVTPRQLITHWPPQCFAELQAAHLEQLLELEPEIVLLGTGARQHFPHPRLSYPLLSRGIGVEAMATAAACRTYNFIVAEGRRVVAALLMIGDD